jgi:hypothetical protein
MPPEGLTKGTHASPWGYHYRWNETPLRQDPPKPEPRGQQMRTIGSNPGAWSPGSSAPEERPWHLRQQHRATERARRTSRLAKAQARAIREAKAARAKQRQEASRLPEES